jgi:hypothetical protein
LASEEALELLRIDEAEQVGKFGGRLFRLRVRLRQRRRLRRKGWTPTVRSCRTWGQGYDHHFWRFSLIFGEKNGVISKFNVKDLFAA